MKPSRITFFGAALPVSAVLPDNVSLLYPANKAVQSSIRENNSSRGYDTI